MGLIINKKIQMLKLGYPTVSDKYNVAGATLTGSTNVGFGAPVSWDSSNGEGAYVKAFDASATLAGFVLATNVKVPTTYPAEDNPVYQPGEALNLVVSGYLAVKCNAQISTAAIQPFAKFSLNANGEVIAYDGSAAKQVNGYFTGVWEKHGSDVLAEIYVENPVA